MEPFKNIGRHQEYITLRYCHIARSFCRSTPGTLHITLQAYPHHHQMLSTSGPGDTHIDLRFRHIAPALVHIDLR